MRKIFLFFLIPLSVLVVYLNVQLLSENYSNQEEKEDIIHQLEFLKLELHQRGLGVRMQQLFPEGYVFVNAMYGLAWCELSLSYPEDLELNKKAIEESSFAFKEIDSEKAKGGFDQDLVPRYGIYYFGWRNYLMSKMILINSEFQSSEIGKEYWDNCIQLADLVENGKTFPESYEAMAWPADMTVAVASMANFERIYGDDRHEYAIKSWVLNIKQKLDPKYHLIPHQVDPDILDQIQGPRGSSQALILRLFTEIDPEFAAKQFNTFRKQFIFDRLDLPALREYPRGEVGEGDVDSGPVIFDVGFAGTIVMIGTYRAFGLTKFADQQYKTINAFGFETTLRSRKKYLFGALPMADAFIAWGRATSPKMHTKFNESDGWSSSTFRLITLIPITLLWTLYLLPFFKRFKKFLKAKRLSE